MLGMWGAPDADARYPPHTHPIPARYPADESALAFGILLRFLYFSRRPIPGMDTRDTRDTRDAHGHLGSGIPGIPGIPMGTGFLGIPSRIPIMPGIPMGTWDTRDTRDTQAP